jgi:hypothetical protein
VLEVLEVSLVVFRVLRPNLEDLCAAIAPIMTPHPARGTGNRRPSREVLVFTPIEDHRGGQATLYAVRVFLHLKLERVFRDEGLTDSPFASCARGFLGFGHVQRSTVWPEPGQRSRSIGLAAVQLFVDPISEFPPRINLYRFGTSCRCLTGIYGCWWSVAYHPWSSSAPIEHGCASWSSSHHRIDVFVRSLTRTAV